MLSRTPLYENNVLTPGTLWLSPNVLSEWTGTNTTPILDKDRVIEGGPALRTVTTTAGVRCYAVKTISAAGTSFGNIFRIWVYIHSPVNDVELINFTLATNSGITVTKYLNWAGSTLEQGWNLLTGYKNGFGTDGGASWTTSTFIRVMLYARPKAGKHIDLTWGPVYVGEVATTDVLFTFDDLYASQKLVVKPIMDVAGFPGAIFCPSSLVGGVGRLSLADLETLEEDGWIICNHTSDHLPPSSQTPVGYAASIDGYFAWADANGFTDGKYIFAHSYGGYSLSQLDILKSKGILAARSIYPRVHVPNERELYTIHSVPPWSTTTLDAAIAYLDAAINTNSSIVYTFHNIVSPVSVVTDWELEKFAGLVAAVSNRVKRGLCSVPRFDVWLSRRTNPRYDVGTITRV